MLISPIATLPGLGTAMALAIHQPGGAGGATPHIEIEPWHAGPGWDETPLFQDIAGNADGADTDCTLDGSSYDASCATWLASIGRAVRQLGKPVVFTFAHEFNAAGRYP